MGMLTDKQWSQIEPHLPKQKKNKKGGRPLADNRKVFEGILWVLWTGSPWGQMPEEYASPATCWRRLKRWQEQGIFQKLWKKFLSQLNKKDKIKWEECFIDGTFVQAKGGGDKVGKTKRGKGTKLVIIAERKGIPLSVHIDSASVSEMKLVEPTLEQVSVGKGTSGAPRKNPDCLIGDKGYDSNKIREYLLKKGIEPIIPARKNNKKATHQDKRKLRRYKRRWVIERTNAWLQNFRRLVVRYENLIEIFSGFVYCACSMIALRRI